ncbi:MAG: hypothetical protein H0V09_10015 [Gemmatimonadetes bacterium]|nr:hypothetical protein [Gemmatimonadota bacterium]
MSPLGRRRILPAILLALLIATKADMAAGQEPGVRLEDGRVYFNLQQVDVRSALESISEVLGISYVMGGSVEPGQLVTINTSDGIPIEDVPDLLDSVLRTYDLTLVRTGDVFTVIPAQSEDGLGTGAGAAAATEVHVYYLRNANAVDLANVLSQLFGGGAPDGGFTRRTQSSRSLSRALEEQQLDFEPAEEPVGGQRVQAVPQPAPNIANAVIQGDLVGQVSIVPDETTNSIVIRTAPENYRSIEETIQKLDVRPLQVLIEATVAEITLDKSTQFGIEYLFDDVVEDGQIKGEIDLENTTPFEGGLRVRILEAGDVDATLRALAADARVNVLSTPRILAVNNQEARILVGQEVPFVQFQRSTIGDAVDRVTQFRNVGLELTVTPRINPDRYVSMDLLQQVSALSADVLFDAPIITTREAETSLIVGDRQTVVLGGLIEERKEKRHNGIPILKDIPLLGFLFGSRSTRTVKTELVITLTPYILGSDEEIQRLRGEIESGTEFYSEEIEKRAREGRPVPGRPGGTGSGRTSPNEGAWEPPGAPPEGAVAPPESLGTGELAPTGALPDTTASGVMPLGITPRTAAPSEWRLPESRREPARGGYATPEISGVLGDTIPSLNR